MAGRNDWKWAAGGVEWGKEATVTGREKPRLFSTPRFDYSDQFPSLYRLFPLLGVGASFPLFLICPRLTELSGGVHSSPPGLRGYGWSTSQARQTEFLRKVTERGEQNDAEVGKGTRLASYLDLLNSLEQNKTREIRKGKKNWLERKTSGDYVPNLCYLSRHAGSYGAVITRSPGKKTTWVQSPPRSNVFCFFSELGWSLLFDLSVSFCILQVHRLIYPRPLVWFF